MKKLVLVFLLFASTAYAFPPGSADCLKCHKLSENEMAPILAGLKMPGAKVLGIQMGPVKGLWEVDLENKGQRFVVYLDFAKRYVTGGPFIDLVKRKDVTRDRIEELNKDRKIDLRPLSLEDALIMGKADAPLRVVVFTDPG